MNQSAPDALLEISSLRKSFGDLEVLKGIDLKVNKSEVISIIGKSGSGKSTLLRCINGLEAFQLGEIKIRGNPVDYENTNALRELRQSVGMVFQSFNLFPAMSVGGNVALAPKVVLGLTDKQANQLAKDLLDQVGLAEKFDSFPFELSGGQQQRVAIARALAMNPDMILCDEITSALDPELVGEVLQVIEKLAQKGVTLMIVTHEMSFAHKVSDRVAFMKDGLIHETGSAADIFERPQSSELKTFLSHFKV
jgi:polar amino acid transport system ATP-binding protein